MIGWILVVVAVIVITVIEVWKSPVMQAEETPAILWWIVAHRSNEQKKRVYFAADPDDALYRWKRDYGNSWYIEIVTTDADRAEKIFNLTGDMP